MPIPSAPTVSLINLGLQAIIPGPPQKAFAQFTWSNPDATAYYRAQYRTPQGSGSYIDYGLAALGASGIDLFELLMNASYDFRFRGENGNRNSRSSATRRGRCRTRPTPRARSQCKSRSLAGCDIVRGSRRSRRDSTR